MDETYEAVAAVARALLSGALLKGKGRDGTTYTAGPWLTSVDRPVRPQYACIGQDGVLVQWGEMHKVVQILPWGVDTDWERTDDWTPFGAAAAFVWAVGPTAALTACTRSADEVHIDPAPEHARCEVHDWPNKGLAHRLIREMRARRGAGIIACADCLNRALDEAKS